MRDVWEITMRSDYPNSDLINKVNSEWINKVLVHPELGGDDPAGDDPADDDPADDDGGDEDDLTLLRDFAVRPGRVRHEPAPVEARFAYPEPSIAVKRMARGSRRRSVARRVTERLVLGVAALGLFAGVWMTPGFQDSNDAVSRPATSEAAEETPEIDTTALRSTEPAWLSPEILYATAIAPSLIRRANAPPFLPRPGR
jgi:hypothetical protein